MSWILHMLVSLNLVFVRAKHKSNTIHLKDLGYCAAASFEKINDILNATFLSVPDFPFVALMVWVSICMLLTLHRHRPSFAYSPSSLSSV